MSTSSALSAAAEGPDDRSNANRIGRAWIELRRGASSTALRDYLYGPDSPLEQGQMDALDVLVRRERTMRGLADKMRIDPSSATRAVQRLEDAGLAERYRSSDDGRVVMVRITPRGREIHAPVAQRRAKAMTRIMSVFDLTEQAQLAALLDRLTASIDDVVAELDDES